MKTVQKKSNNDSNRSATDAAQSNWQNQLAQVADNSKEAVAQRAFIAGINDSPRMAAQRRQIECYLGTGQSQTSESLHPASPINQRQPIQRVKKLADEEKQPLQRKFAAESTAQREQQPVAKANNTGLPDNLKSGIENLSGVSMDNVKVHYNSSQPAQLNALAYAQGTDIHIAPGQEQHLPHEAWHVVQQAQGRVKPTMQMKSRRIINNDLGLETEADLMGGQALSGVDNIGVAQCASEDSRWANTHSTVPAFPEIQATGSIIQMVNRGKKKVPAKMVRKRSLIPWVWTDNLAMTWGEWKVPTNTVHDGDMLHDQLKGGYTILFGNGKFTQKSNYGPYSPGMGKNNHVERKFWSDMEGQLETDIAADDTEDEDALVVIDINQHHTPCSGPEGCTTFLNNQLVSLCDWDGVTSVGRFKASDRYDSGLSETHPKHPKLKKGEVTDMELEDAIDLDNIVGDKKAMAFHSYTEQDK